MKQVLNKDFIKWLSNKKSEDQDMLKFRLASYEKFKELEEPNFGPTLNINFEDH